MQFGTFRFRSRRSNVIARQGMVATSHPLAAQAGLEVLQSGGNAVDAAIATAATLCVVEPTSTGIGGDAFALIWRADEEKLYGLNASGGAPHSLDSNALRQEGHDQIPLRGGLSVTVPGSVRGWAAAIERFGTKDLGALLMRPIQYAYDGFPVSEIIAHGWQAQTDLLSVHADSARVWLPQGRAPIAGEVFANREIARTLAILAERGPEAFYTGQIAEQIVRCVQEDGGFLSLSDMAQCTAEWVEPISVSYGDGYRLFEIPPNGQGLTALLALRIVAGLDLQRIGYGTVDYYHVLIEAIKLAFSDAETYLGDPYHVDVPVDLLLKKSYASRRRNEIEMDQAARPRAGDPYRHGDTVYLVTADGAGNMVSWIQSLYHGFGSGLTAGDTGIQLHNRGANFNLEAGHPNEAAPGKRPFHTIIPGFITQHGQAWAAFGVMGGFMQPQGHLQVGLNLMEFGMDPQTALDAPRVRWLRDKAIALEDQIDDDVRRQLLRRGHHLLGRQAPGFFGGGQVIVRDSTSGVLIGGSEPRKDGMAVGW